MPIAGLISSELVATPSVCPSGGAFATAVVIRIVPAPGRFSTNTVLPPQRAERRSARMRATTSVGPPAANGTRILTGLAGKSDVCAAADDSAHALNASAASQCLDLVLSIRAALPHPL